MVLRKQGYHWFLLTWQSTLCCSIAIMEENHLQKEMKWTPQWEIGTHYPTCLSESSSGFNTVYRDYNVHFWISWYKPGLHFKNGMMHIYKPLLPDFSLKEVIPSSKLRGKSGVFSPHLRPVGILTKGVGLYFVSTSRVQPCPPKPTN